MTSIPWVEKYRPTHFDDIVLDQDNQNILRNMIDTNSFPNMLFYGPPGTGKTTTVTNLINTYQERYNQHKKGLMIHLNASDDRGIDIIRNQISQFVNSQPLFSKGLKIVVLDEVDYMTKNAQQALKYLIQGGEDNVRFCLICNYISRIDESLQNELIHLRFNCLPPEKIIDFLDNINHKENIGASREVLHAIQQLYKSDIRSMVNYMQSNQYNIDTKKVIDSAVWEELLESLHTSHEQAKRTMNRIEYDYQIDDRNIIKEFMQHIVFTKTHLVTPKLLKVGEFIYHLPDKNVKYMRDYFIYNIIRCLQTP